MSTGMNTDVVMEAEGFPATFCGRGDEWNVDGVFCDNLMMELIGFDCRIGIERFPVLYMFTSVESSRHILRLFT